MCENPDEIAKRPPKRSAPRIACFLGETPQYFLIVEEKVLFSVASLSRAIIFWFVIHYVLNLEYCSCIKSVAFFIQDFVFKLPTTSFMKQQKSVGYLTVTTDIQKFI